MAAPHLAGGVALLWQADPTLVGNIDLTQDHLQRAATHLIDVQAVGNCRGPLAFQDNTFGWGLLNLLKAVQDTRNPRLALAIARLRGIRGRIFSV